MSTGTDPISPEPDGLQFDHAEFDGDRDQAGPALACATCKRPIAETYYALNQMVICEDCRAGIERHFEGGSGIARLLRAGLFGSAAALAGATLYFVILWKFKLEAAIISILVGFLVGKAVHKGSRDRGGLPYQVMAVLLTYFAIGLAYTSNIIANQIQELRAEVRANQAKPKGKDQAKADPAAPKAAGQAKAAEDDDDEAPPEINAAVIGQLAAALIGVTFIAPALVAQQSFLSLVIIGFALWEAWKFTRRARLVFTGPYRAGDADGGPPGIGGPAHA